MLRCAISALSTLRTVCFGDTSAVVSTWISSTAPVSLATMRTATTPGSVASNSSARLMGSTLPAMAPTCGGCGAGVAAISALMVDFRDYGGDAEAGAAIRRRSEEPFTLLDTGVFGTRQY
jgi:hypothetical protein